MCDNITLDELRNLQRVAGVMEHEPSTYDHFAIPDDLKDGWKRYVAEKNAFNEILERYNFHKIL